MKLSLSSRSKQLQARNKTNAQVTKEWRKKLTMCISLVTEVEGHELTFSCEKRKDIPI